MGLTAILQGVAYLSRPGVAPIWMWSLGLLALLSGAALIVGVLTLGATALIAFGAMGTAFSWLPAPTPNLFDRMLPTALVIVVTVAIALLGPGAWSMDARFFGLRKITIPRTPRSPDA